MRKEIVLPFDLYHRIRISAEEHGGIGGGDLFEDGIPLCVHGHAWGSWARFATHTGAWGLNEPELWPFLTWDDNDQALRGAGIPDRRRVPFSRWCEHLNVKCGFSGEAGETSALGAAQFAGAI